MQLEFINVLRKFWIYIARKSQASQSYGHLIIVWENKVYFREYVFNILYAFVALL